MSVPLFPFYGYPLAKADMEQSCQRVAERLHLSSRGVLDRVGMSVPLFPLYGYPLVKARRRFASG
jgi:hypothetical protein